MTSRWQMALLVTVCVALLAPGAPPAAAQQGIATLSAEAGIGNWVRGNAPITIHATVEAELLVTGTLEVVYGGATTHILVDVPAGGAKTYDIPVRSAFRNGSIRINLLDDDGVRIATQTVRPEVATDEIVVGVVTDPAVEATLSSLESLIDGLPVVPVEAPAALTSGEAHALSYLVSSDPTPEQWRWVTEGGRLITGATAIASATIALQPLDHVPGTRVDWYRGPGGGEVFLLDTIAGPQDWRAVLRPAPLDLIPNDQWGTPESSLLRSATGSGDGGLASLPWLPFGMLAYLIVIGPVNMLVLKRIGRREWAWVSIPALAFLAVGVFWLAGRQRLDTTTARHATVSVAGDHPYQRSLLVLAAGKAGDYSVSLDEAEAYAMSDVSSAWGGSVGTTAPGTVNASGVSWDLPQLGVGAVETWSTPDGSLRATPSEDTDSIAVTNDTGHEIDHWGAVANGGVYVAGDPLSPGETATIGLDDRFGGWPGASLGDAVVEFKQLWDSFGWEVVAPLGYVAQTEAGPASFAFGIIESSPVEVTVNGVARAVEGPTVWVAPFDGVRGLRTVSGTVVGVGDWRHIEVGQGSLWLETDHILLRFLADPAARRLVPRIDPAFGGVGAIEAWNWATGAFEPVDRDQPIDAAGFMAPNGEVIVRQASVEETGEPPYPQALTIGWDEPT